MFEKEAEEYASNVFNPVQEKFFITRGLVQGHIAVAFKDGAEFGYNKAKEEDKWHKVHIMEGFVDLPDEEGTYLCCLQDGKADEYMYEVLDICIDGNGDCYLSSMVWTIDELIAWKDITPPKEIKEND